MAEYYSTPQRSVRRARRAVTFESAPPVFGLVYRVFLLSIFCREGKLVSNPNFLSTDAFAASERQGKRVGLKTTGRAKTHDYFLDDESNSDRHMVRNGASAGLRF
jgi:hypothetical protein